MKVVHVGLGDFGASWLRDVLLPHPDVDVVGVVDLDDRRACVATASGLTPDLFTTDVWRALDRTRADLLVLATPPGVRAAALQEALGRGVPVLVEKPAAATEDDARDLWSLAAAHGTRVFVAENYRYRRVFRTLRTLLAEPGIGTVTRVHALVRRRHRIANYHARMPHPALLDVGTHHVDVLRYVTRDEVLDVHADTWCAPESWYTEHADVLAVGRLSGGARWTLDVALDAPADATAWTGTWAVETTRAAIAVRGTAVTVRPHEGPPRELVVDDDDGRRALLDDVLGALSTDRPTDCDLAVNLPSLAVSLAAVRAARTGSTAVPVDLCRPPAPDPAGQRTHPRSARRVTMVGPHERLAAVHGGVGVVDHVQLLSDADFAGPVRFVNHTVLPPGASIGSHRHGDDEELYVVLSGTGRMTVDGTDFPVAAGDVVVNQPDGTHGLVNDSSTDLALLVVEVGLRCHA